MQQCGSEAACGARPDRTKLRETSGCVDHLNASIEKLKLQPTEINSSSASARCTCLRVSITPPVQHHRRLGGGRPSLSASAKAVAPPPQAPPPSAERFCQSVLSALDFFCVCFYFHFFVLQHAVERRWRVGCCVLPDDMHRLKRLTYHDVCGVVVAAIIYSPHAAI